MEKAADNTATEASPSKLTAAQPVARKEDPAGARAIARLFDVQARAASPSWARHVPAENVPLQRGAGANEEEDSSVKEPRHRHRSRRYDEG